MVPAPPARIARHVSAPPAIPPAYVLALALDRLAVREGLRRLAAGHLG